MPETDTAISENLDLLDAIDAAEKARDSAALAKGLRYALTAIANYRLDAREVHESKLRPGFCQGTFYLDTYRLVLKAMKGQV